MSALPAWAATAEARPLLAKLIVEQPSISVYDDGLSSWNGRKVIGKTARAIRAIYDHWYDSQIDACSAVVHGSPEYDQLRDATLAVETADHLMERLLDEAAMQADVEVLADGSARWAA